LCEGGLFYSNGESFLSNGGLFFSDG